MANDTVRHFLFRNRGDGTFEEVGESRGFALNAAGLTTSGMGIDAAWIHNDDELAIAMSNFANEMTSLYVLQGKDDLFFTDETISAGIGGPTRNVLTFGLLFDDFDLDGRVDLVETNGHLEETITIAQPSQQYRQPAKLFWNAGADKQPEFVDLPAENIGDLAKPIVGRGLASADIDGDGDVDLVINQVEGPPLLLRNDQKLSGHWLRCKLEGPSGNPHAIGAVIELRAGGVRQRRKIQPTRSYLSQTEPIVTFGLGTSTAVDSLMVTWPDGSKQEEKVEGVDRVVTIRQRGANIADDAASGFSTLANTAKAQLENGEFEEAVPTLKQALEQRPESAAMRRNLARAYTLSGQPALAFEELTRLQAAASQPSAAIEYLSGLAALRQIRNDDAAEHFRKAIELDPNEATLRFQYGLALTALGRADDAKQQFEKAAELDPLHGGAQYQLATIARKAGDQEAFARYMGDFTRIRAIKGPADPQSLEENRYTKAEGPETAAKPPPIPPGPTAVFTASATASAEGAAPAGVVAMAVLSMDDAGKYQSAAVTSDGLLLVLEFDPAAGFKEIARSEQAIGTVGDQATLLVGNAFVDAAARSAGRPDEESKGQGDQPEIAIVTPQQTWLVRYRPDAGFEDLTAASNLSPAGGDAAHWIDLDHDGDIDLCTASSAGLRVWRNNSDGRFVEATNDFGLSDVGPCVDLAAADFDASNLGVDLVVAGPKSTSLYRNQYAGRFARDEQIARNWPAAERVLVDDFNNDGRPDVVFISAADATLVVTSQDERQQLALGLEQIDAATTIDVDNDGWLDLAVAGAATMAPKLVVTRNVGGRFAAAVESLPAPAQVRRNGLLDADIDGDSRTDLTLIGEADRLVFMRNETPTSNRQLKLALRSFVGSPSSIGVRVEVRSGDHIVSRWTSRELPIEIGLAQNTKADSIQTLWMNGIARNEIGLELTSAPVRITIVEFVRTSSCPFLYAWGDGAWEFVTDILGTAPLNVSVARGVPLPLDPDEVVVLGPAERFADGAAAARLRVTSELREVIYFDHSQLLAVDHPADTSVFSRDRVAPTAIDGKQIVAGRNPRAPRSVTGSDGIDRTAALAEEDGVFAPCGRVLPPPCVGFTEPLSIELDFGELIAPRSHALRGNASPRRSASLEAGACAAERRGIPSPRRAWEREQRVVPRAHRLVSLWQLVDKHCGFAARRFAGDLAKARSRWFRWPMANCGGDGRLSGRKHEDDRVRPLRKIARWHPAPAADDFVRSPLGPDRTLRYRAGRCASRHRTRTDDCRSSVAWLCRAACECGRPAAGTKPFAHKRQAVLVHFRGGLVHALRRHSAACGEIRSHDGDSQLGRRGDDRVFSECAAAREPGTARTLMLYTRGWIKEADPNTLPDRRVDPLPAVRESLDAASPVDWQLEYNTRWVPQHAEHTFAPDQLR